jgi:hypothetical protein
MKRNRIGLGFVFAILTGLLALGGMATSTQARAISAAEPAHTSSASYTRPYISPGMHPGEVLAVFPASASGTLKASAPYNTLAFDRPDQPGQGEPYNVGSYGVCNSASYCINDTAGNLNSGNVLQVWQNSPEGANNNSWLALYVGTVRGTNCTTNCWPFVPGSGFNAEFNGEWVTNFEFFKGQSDMTDKCIVDATGYEDNYVQLGNCSSYSSDDQQSWQVWGDGGYRIKGVHLSNTPGNGTYTAWTITISTNGGGSYGNGSQLYYLPLNNNSGSIQIFSPTGLQ